MLPKMFPLNYDFHCLQFHAVLSAMPLKNASSSTRPDGL